MITKEIFTQAINAMMNIDDYQKAKNELYKKFSVDGFLWEPDNSDVIIKLLKLLFPEECDTDAISVFCLKNNYGRGKSNQFYIDPDGQKIPMNSAEDLYKYIVSTTPKEGNSNQ